MSKMTNEPIESYLLLIMDIINTKYIYTVVPTNKEMSRLFAVMDDTKYMIVTVTPLANVQSFIQVYKQMLKTDKPTDMEFGGDKDE